MAGACQKRERGARSWAGVAVRGLAFVVFGGRQGWSVRGLRLMEKRACYASPDRAGRPNVCLARIHGLHFGINHDHLSTCAACPSRNRDQRRILGPCRRRVGMYMHWVP
jgi:hypothetical protein